MEALLRAPFHGGPEVSKNAIDFSFLIQDGGCTCPGDVAKAIGAGADFVMLGGMLAGHDQVPDPEESLIVSCLFI